MTEKKIYYLDVRSRQYGNNEVSANDNLEVVGYRNAIAKARATSSNRPQYTVIIKEGKQYPNGNYYKSTNRVAEYKGGKKVDNKKFHKK